MTAYVDQLSFNHPGRHRSNDFTCDGTLRTSTDNPIGLKGVFGSLTFGGYDASRFVPNNVSFSLAPDDSRDIVVGLHSITAKDANGSTTSLLPSPILTFIDSTVPYIYLPSEACRLFENAFGLVWNATLELYLVNDTLHESLLAKNATFTFQIGDTTTGEPAVEIVLPYASFDLIGEYPLVDETTRYFPIQQGNETQYTLGRTFLQEAYVSDTLAIFSSYDC